MAELNPSFRFYHIFSRSQSPDIRPAQCFLAFFARADADDVVDAGDENLAVADVACIEFELEELDEVRDSLPFADDEEAGLRQELDFRGFFRCVFIRTVLDAAAERLKDRDARDAGRAELLEERCGFFIPIMISMRANPAPPAFFFASFMPMPPLQQIPSHALPAPLPRGTHVPRHRQDAHSREARRA